MSQGNIAVPEIPDPFIHEVACPIRDILDRVRIEPLKVALERELYTQLARDLAEVDHK